MTTQTRVVKLLSNCCQTVVAFGFCHETTTRQHFDNTLGPAPEASRMPPRSPGGPGPGGPKRLPRGPRKLREPKGPQWFKPPAHRPAPSPQPPALRSPAQLSASDPRLLTPIPRPLGPRPPALHPKHTSTRAGAMAARSACELTVVVGQRPGWGGLAVDQKRFCLPDCVSRETPGKAFKCIPIVFLRSF